MVALLSPPPPTPSHDGEGETLLTPSPRGEEGGGVAAAQRYLLAGQVDAARQAIDRALALNPQDAAAYSLRSTLELTQNRRTQARADAERAIAANPSSLPPGSV